MSKTKPVYIVEYDIDKKGEYYVRIKHINTNKIFVSGDGYKRKASAIKATKNLFNTIQETIYPELDYKIQFVDLTKKK